MERDLYNYFLVGGLMLLVVCYLLNFTYIFR